MSEKKTISDAVAGLREVAYQNSNAKEIRQKAVSNLANLARGQQQQPRSTELSRAAKGLK